MTEDQEERLTCAFSEIAIALKELSDQAKKAGQRYWPEPKEQREAVVSVVETPEERELRRQSGWIRDAKDIIDPTAEEPEEYIGARTAQWIRDHPKDQVSDAGAEARLWPEEGGSGAQEAENQA